LPDSPNQQTSVILANYLQGKQSLLVVDNCEHLIEECAHLIESLLSKCVNLKFMVTSREPLAIMGEMVYQVFPLSVPMLNETSIKRSLQSESVRLFVDRAREATSGFSISDQNFAAVIRVCQRLDGIPLAIELAARVTSLTVEHIAERLDDRFNLLTSGSRTALPRQQTLRATIEWSHDLLPERTRILFRRLSVFPGGFGREAVEAICSDENLAAIEVLKELSRLVDRSLLEVRLNGKDERYRMLETIRLFAHEQLQESGEEKRLREKHLKYFTEWAEEVEPRLRGPEQLAWWDRMEIEHDNIRTALGWSLEGDAAQFGLRLACAAYWFWFYRCYWREGLKWFKDLLAKIPTREQTSTRAKARVAAGILAWNLSPKEPVEESYNESIQYWRKIGDQWWAAYGLGCSGWYSLYSGDPISSQTKFKQAVSCARKSGDGWILGYSLHGLGAAVERINYGEAVPILEESIEIWRKVGVKEGLAEALNQLGTVAHGQNDDKRALPLYEESLALFREIGSKSSIGMVQLCLAELLQRAGDNTRAARLHTESLTIAADLGDQKAIADNLFGLAGVAGGQSKPRRAARLLGAAQSIYDSICMNLSAWPYVLADYNRWVSTARAQLDEAAFTTAYEQGKAMTPDQAIKYARDSKKDG
jgi:predicted ATPase